MVMRAREREKRNVCVKEEQSRREYVYDMRERSGQRGEEQGCHRTNTLRRSISRTRSDKYTKPDR